MAWIEERPSTHGGTQYRVGWRRDGAKESATFDAAALARQARALVEGLRGHVDPETVYRRVYGLPDPVPASPPVKTFGTWAQEWFPRKSGVQEDTVERYRRQWELHIRDVEIGGRALGEHPIEDITPVVIAQWVQLLHHGQRCEQCAAEAGEPCAMTCPRKAAGWAGGRRGMSAPTLHRYHAVLHQLLRDAAAEPGIPLVTNPAAATRLPREDAERDDQEHVYLTHAEAQLLIARMNSQLARDVTVFLLGTGLRWSEMSALQTRDVDLLARVPHIKVQRAWKHSKRRGWYLGPPKSRESRRTVTVSPEVVEILTRRLDLTNVEASVFTAPKGSRLDNDNARRDWWDPAVHAANGRDKNGRPRRGDERPLTLLGKDPTPHDLRHTHASWLIADKAELVRVSRRLGHASVDFTARIYVHIHRDDDEELLADLDRALKPPQVQRGNASQPRNG